MVFCKEKAISLIMKIGIDARLWGQTGVGRYTRNLIINLQEIDKKNFYTIFVTKNDEKDVAGILINKNWKTVRANSRWHSIDEQIGFPKKIEKEHLDLMHFPYFSIPVLYKKPYVVTIHDLILHHFSTGKASTLPLWLYGFKIIAYRVVINSAARNSKKIISVSNSTKKEIVDHLRVSPEKIEVIYEAADDLRTSSNEKINIENYFLFVGNVYPHKNVEKMIKAFNTLSQKVDIKLVFAGKDDFFYKRLRKKMRKMEEKGLVHFIFDATDKKLASLYKNAIALIRPSLMEGFSLPPLEAMENNCLVVASDISVHREIFGDNIIYFDPTNVYDIVSKMQEVLSLPKDKKEKMQKSAKLRAQEFSWKATAQRTLEVYESSLGV